MGFSEWIQQCPILPRQSAKRLPGKLRASQELLDCEAEDRAWRIKIRREQRPRKKRRPGAEAEMYL